MLSDENFPRRVGNILHNILHMRTLCARWMDEQESNFKWDCTTIQTKFIRHYTLKNENQPKQSTLKKANTIFSWRVWLEKIFLLFSLERIKQLTVTTIHIQWIVGTKKYWESDIGKKSYFPHDKAPPTSVNPFSS